MNHHWFFYILLIITLLQLSSSPGSTSSTKGLESVENTRLGSTPPSCHSKCNECRPCFAVQVPTQPSLNHNQVRLRPSTPHLMDLYDLHGNGYSPYKPLGWKCLCNNHFYNP